MNNNSGYEKALNNAPVLVDGKGVLYNMSIDLLIAYYLFQI